MQLVRYNPMNNRVGRHSNLNNFFDGFFDDFFGPAYHPGKVVRKAQKPMQVDIYEKDNVIVLEAELPGVAKEDIKLDVKGKLITLGAERKGEEEVKDEHRYRKERTYGKLERTFSLPFEINAEQVAASYENGILRLEIPQPEEKKSTQIEIK